MQTRILGQSLEVTALGSGCTNLNWAYGPATDKQLRTDFLIDGGVIAAMRGDTP